MGVQGFSELSFIASFQNAVFKYKIRSALSIVLKMWICFDVIDKLGNLSITQNPQLLMCNYLWKTLYEGKTLNVPQ